MATTTFVDVKMTEKVEDYRYEKQNYTFNEDEVISLPAHTASRFVNKWGYAEYTDLAPYEVKQEDYEHVLCRVRNKDDEDKKENTDGSEGITNQEYLENNTVADIEQRMDEIVEEGINEHSEVEDDIMYMEALLSDEKANKDRKGVIEAVESAIEELKEE